MITETLRAVELSCLRTLKERKIRYWSSTKSRFKGGTLLFEWTTDPLKEGDEFVEGMSNNSTTSIVRIVSKPDQIYFKPWHVVLQNLPTNNAPSSLIRYWCHWTGWRKDELIYKALQIHQAVMKPLNKSLLSDHSSTKCALTKLLNHVRKSRNLVSKFLTCLFRPRISSL